MKAKVTYYRPNNEGGVIAYLGLYIEEFDLYFSKLRLIRTKNNGLFVAPPSEKFIAPEGTAKYANFFWFGKAKSQEFQDAASIAISQYAKTLSQKDSTPKISHEPDPTPPDMADLPDTPFDDSQNQPPF